MKSFYVQAKACYCFQNVFISQSFLILIVIKKLVLVKETVDMKMLSSCQTVRDLRLKRGVIFDSLLVGYSLFVVKTIAKIPRCKIHSLLVTNGIFFYCCFHSCQLQSRDTTGNIKLIIFQKTWEFRFSLTSILEPHTYKRVSTCTLASIVTVILLVYLTCCLMIERPLPTYFPNVSTPQVI